ncbi:hypothetical protein [Paraburkholderia sp. BCC1886]|uniref:hypothetical protein n=1 Tax=Paraburkholderia sp. BCC1886 TaxID=2562670 RepID=UPI0021B47FE7|nr:hypothetical protein [Paraburkholderia sp. BCC1886]
MAAMGAALLLAGCGGGGSSGSPSPATSANLSAIQKSYESAALALNGGLHYLSGGLTLSSSSNGTLGVSSSSYFYATDSSIPQSPSIGTQTLTVTTSNVSKSLAVPTIIPPRMLVNGTIYSGSVPEHAQVSYSGDNVQEDYLATDGKTIMRTLIGTGYDVVSLSGPISASPTELFADSALGLLTNSINGQPLYNAQTRWQSGAAYVKIVRHAQGDEVYVGDCVAPVTTGTNPTPCSTTASTLESFFPYASTADAKTYQITDGQIVTLGGARAWVATLPLASATPSYRVYFQGSAGIQAGYLIKDGTTLQLVPLGGGTAQDSYFFLNNAALQTVKSAIAF